LINVCKRRIRQGLKLLQLLQVPSFRKALLKGVGATVEHARALRPLRVNTVVDVGAHQGQFALLAREVWKNARIISFEPQPIPYSIYQKIMANDANACIHAVAIGPEHCTLTMHISRRSDSSSLLPITRQQQAIFQGTEEVATLDVPVAPLQAYIAPDELATPALLKIDVQGFEDKVLAGCGDLLVRFSYVYIELSMVELYAGQVLADEVIRTLQAHGFALRGVYNTSYDSAGQVVQADFLFAAKQEGNDG